MRLRLRVHRNELPAVSALWPVPDTHRRTTIAQLLEHVNGTFPLEGESWGLEDYIVSVGGYDCLHYHELGAVFKDEDEVVIKPLQYVEIRARTLTGRDQISGDGRHLVDGVPFGRPQLKAPVRPDVRIPPRKKRKLASPREETNGEGFDVVKAPILAADEDFDNEGSNEEDADFEDDGEDNDDSSGAASSEDESYHSSEDDDSSSISSTSDSDPSEVEPMSEKSWTGVASQPPPTPPRNRILRIKPDEHVNKATSSPGRETPARSSHKRKRHEEADAEVHKQDESKKPTSDGLPYEGKTETQQRNARRRDTKKLRHLKAVGVLPSDANIASLKAWEQGHMQEKLNHAAAEHKLQPNYEAMNVNDNLAVISDAPALGTANEILAETSNHVLWQKNGRDAEPVDKKRSNKTTKLQNQRQQLLDAIASGGIDVTRPSKRTKRHSNEVDDDEPPDEISSKHASARDIEIQTNGKAGAVSDHHMNTDATSTVQPPTVRRSKLDVAGSKRLVFGSLGVRVPKTQDEKDALQKKLAARPLRGAASAGSAPNHNDSLANGTATTQEAEQMEEEAPEAWQSKIDLSAVECCDEGVTLEMPPFPFYQRWDPQFRANKKKKRLANQYAAQKLKKQGRKDGAPSGEYVETYDKYNEDGTGDALEYDDAVEDDEYWEEGALLNGDDEEDSDADAATQQLLNESAEQEVEDDFPTLPGDVATLPPLAETDAQKNDYIVYKELVCSAATSWQPTMLTRTAQLQSKDEVGWTMKLAPRDLRPKAYDSDGKRVYQKFEMEGMSDDGEDGDERTRTGKWEELVEPRLLERADSAGEV